MIFQNESVTHGIKSTQELEISKCNNEIIHIQLTNHIDEEKTGSTYAFILLNDEEISLLINELKRLQKL